MTGVVVAGQGIGYVVEEVEVDEGFGYVAEVVEVDEGFCCMTEVVVEDWWYVDAAFGLPEVPASALTSEGY
jgi:hypothetical protein